MKKQIIIDYNEYLEKEDEIKELKFLLSTVYFNEKISEKLKNEIQKMNKLYGWWI